MKSFQEAFYLESRNPLLRLMRNLRLLGYMLHVIWFWSVAGGRVRRAVRRARQTGEPFYIDQLGQAAQQNTAAACASGASPARMRRREAERASEERARTPQR